MHLDTHLFYFLQVTRNFDAMAVRIIDKAQSEVMTIALWGGGGQGEGLFHDEGGADDVLANSRSVCTWGTHHCPARRCKSREKQGRKDSKVRKTQSSSRLFRGPMGFLFSKVGRL